MKGELVSMNSILIHDAEALGKLLVWRNLNKDIVRSAPIPVIGGVALNVGSIEYSNYIKVIFQRKGSVVHIQFSAGGRQYVSFDYDFSTWKMDNIDYRAQSIPYPMDSALQDILTVYASAMAFIHANPDKVIQYGAFFEINP
jgi:hypothetical protein